MTWPDPHRQLGSGFSGFSGGRFTACSAYSGRLLSEMRAKSDLFRRFGGFATNPRTTGEACKTVRVTPGPDAVQRSTLGIDQPLGAAPAVPEDLGPISPELALVDHVLAERARVLLPEPREQTRPRRPIATMRPSAQVAERPKMAPAPRIRSQPRRLRRTLLLAALVFAAGAASGGFVGREHGASSPVMLEIRAGAPSTPTATGATEQPRLDTSSARRKASRQRSVSTSARRPAAKRDGRRPGPRTWAANVLGVTAAVDVQGVRLVWQRPGDSHYVVVLRKLDPGTRNVVVFRGATTSYRDVSARRCTAYRYTIVNHDQRGRRSTGVPTSIVTSGCT